MNIMRNLNTREISGLYGAGISLACLVANHFLWKAGYFFSTVQNTKIDYGTYSIPNRETVLDSKGKVLVWMSSALGVLGSISSYLTINNTLRKWEHIIGPAGRGVPAIFAGAVLLTVSTSGGPINLVKEPPL